MAPKTTEYMAKYTLQPFADESDEPDLLGPLEAQTLEWIRLYTPPSSILTRLTGEARVRYHRQRRAGFLDLPGEIQNIIYRYTLVVDEPINGILTKVPNIRLLHLCRKIHKDASSIFYGENTFTFGIESDWIGQVMLMIYGAPTTLEIWPAPTYHAFLHKLIILFSFSPGDYGDFEAPCIQQQNIRSMRPAFGSIWERLDITYDFTQGSFGSLSFTIAWLKFRFFEPISHPNCIVKIMDSVPKSIQWCLRKVLQERILDDGLEPEQVQAIAEAEIHAINSYKLMYSALVPLKNRLIWGLSIPPDRMRLYGCLIHPIVNRIVDPSRIFPLIDQQFSRIQAFNILLQDNRMRVVAAMEMPEEKDLRTSEYDRECHVYFILQEAAVRAMSMRKSYEERMRIDQNQE